MLFFNIVCLLLPLYALCADKRETIEEGKTITLSCDPREFIQILDAEWLLRLRGGALLLMSKNSITNYNNLTQSDETFLNVAKRCNNQNKCTLESVNSGLKLLTNRNSKVELELQVYFQCNRESSRIVIPEHDKTTRKISCEDGKYLQILTVDWKLLDANRKLDEGQQARYNCLRVYPEILYSIQTKCNTKRSCEFEQNLCSNIPKAVKSTGCTEKFAQLEVHYGCYAEGENECPNKMFIGKHMILKDAVEPEEVLQSAQLMRNFRFSSGGPQAEFQTFFISNSMKYHRNRKNLDLCVFESPALTYLCIKQSSLRLLLFWKCEQYFKNDTAFHDTKTGHLYPESDIETYRLLP